MKMTRKKFPKINTYVNKNIENGNSIYQFQDCGMELKDDYVKTWKGIFIIKKQMQVHHMHHRFVIKLIFNILILNLVVDIHINIIILLNVKTI